MHPPSPRPKPCILLFIPFLGLMTAFKSLLVIIAESKRSDRFMKKMNEKRRG